MRELDGFCCFAVVVAIIAILVCVGMVSHMVYACVICPVFIDTECEVISEDHYITNIDFKDATGTKQSWSFGMYMDYDITIDTGEILSTKIKDLELNKTYRMEIHGYNNKNNGLFRYVEEVL